VDRARQLVGRLLFRITVDVGDVDLGARIWRAVRPERGSAAGAGRSAASAGG
jgi:hypothetical protein